MIDENLKTRVRDNDPASVEGNIGRIAKIEAEQQRSRTYTEKIAMVITKFAGSMPFLYFHIFLVIAWIVTNLGFYEFDKFPFFFLVFIIGVETLFLSIFILISRNHQDTVDRRQNHLHLQINMLAEQESTKTLELLQKVAEKVGIDASDIVMEHLLADIHPEDLVERIVDATDGPVKGSK